MAEAPAGYAAARDAAVLVDRGRPTVVRVWGREPVKMVQGLLTNDVAAAPASRAVYGAFLTPKGRMVADARVVRLGEELLIEAAPAAADGLLGHLKRYLPPLFARHEDASAAWSLLGVYGPEADAALRAAGLEPPEEPGEDAVARRSVDGHDVLVLRTGYAGVPGLDLLVRAEVVDGLRAALLGAGTQEAAERTLEVLRIEAGRPRWGAELDEERIPLEAGLKERAISTGKGCYTGQEVIIRILHRGHVNWTLRGLLLGDADPPAAGAELTRGGSDKAVARVTSACVSPRLGQTIALGYVRREVEPGEALELPGGGRARVVALPFPAGEEAPG